MAQPYDNSLNPPLGRKAENDLKCGKPRSRHDLCSALKVERWRWLEILSPSHLN
jgi:hypothetical protein